MKIIISLLLTISLHAQTVVISGGTPVIGGGGSGSSGSGQVPTINGAGQGFYASRISRSSSVSTGYLGTTIANQGNCRAFYLPFTRTISGAAFWLSSAVATSTVDVGIYSTSGTLLANVGGIATGTTANTLYNQPITQGSVTLQGGNYYYGCSLSVTAGAPVVPSQVSASSGSDTPGNAGGSILAIFTSATGGVLPATLPTLTNSTSIASPMIWWY